MTKVYDTPSDVSAEEGHVLVDGPDGVAVSLTVEAAEETGQRLLGAAANAAAEQRSHRPKQASEDAPPLT